ncbi:MAG: TfoX/Sxy family protein [Candidatus Limnocylindria bacterium]
MAFDEHLAQRVRALLDARPDVDDRRMFGGIGFLIAGNMCCGVHGDDLIVRVDPGDCAELMERETGARPFDMTGRPMRGWLFVAADATAEDPDLERWVRRAEAFASALPPK